MTSPANICPACKLDTIKIVIKKGRSRFTVTQTCTNCSERVFFTALSVAEGVARLPVREPEQVRIALPPPSAHRFEYKD
jgi:hypothetical protein